VIQDFVGRDVLGICRSGPDCAQKVGVGLGPISTPLLSLTAFVLIVLLLLRVRRSLAASAESPRLKQESAQRPRVESRHPFLP
jgi:hypothetical protein